MVVNQNNKPFCVRTKPDFTNANNLSKIARKGKYAVEFYPFAIEAKLMKTFNKAVSYLKKSNSFNNLWNSLYKDADMLETVKMELSSTSDYFPHNLTIKWNPKLGRTKGGLGPGSKKVQSAAIWLAENLMKLHLDQHGMLSSPLNNKNKETIRVFTAGLASDLNELQLNQFDLNIEKVNTKGPLATDIVRKR